MFRMTVVALTVAFVAILPASAAAAETTTCTGVLSAEVPGESVTIEGDVVVPAGASCTLLNVTINGDLRVGAGASATFGISGSSFPFGSNTVTGDVIAIGAAELSLAFAHVGGSVIAVNGGDAGLFRSSVTKNLTFVGNDSIFLFSAAVHGLATCHNNGTVFVRFFGADHWSGQCVPDE
jgi:hypothetical protein